MMASGRATVLRRAFDSVDSEQARRAILEYVAMLDERRFRAIVAATIRASSAQELRRYYESRRAYETHRDAFAAVLINEPNAINRLPSAEKKRLCALLPQRSRPRSLLAPAVALAAATVIVLVAYGVFVSRVPATSHAHARNVVSVALHRAPRVASAIAHSARAPHNAQSAARASPLRHDPLPTRARAALKLAVHRSGTKPPTRHVSAKPPEPLSVAVQPAPQITPVASSAPVQTPEAFAADVLRSSDPDAVIEHAAVVSRDSNEIVVELTSTEEGRRITDDMTLRQQAGDYEIVSARPMNAAADTAADGSACYRRSGWYSC